MMLMGRNGYEKYCCLQCKNKKSEWCLYYYQNKVTENSDKIISPWTNQELASSAIERDNNKKIYQNEGKTECQIAKSVPSTGAKKPPLKPFVPITKKCTT